MFSKFKGEIAKFNFEGPMMKGPYAKNSKQKSK